MKGRLSVLESRPFDNYLSGSEWSNKQYDL